jgi:hypothetical protein
VAQSVAAALSNATHAGPRHMHTQTHTHMRAHSQTDAQLSQSWQPKNRNSQAGGFGAINGPRQDPWAASAPVQVHAQAHAMAAGGRRSRSRQGCRLREGRRRVPRRRLHRPSVSCHLPLKCAPRRQTAKEQGCRRDQAAREDGIPSRPNTWRFRAQASVMDRRAPWQQGASLRAQEAYQIVFDGPINL